MIEIQNMLPVPVVNTVTLNTGGTATATSFVVDTHNWQHAAFYVFTGTMAASSNISVCKITESATSGGSYTDIAGAALADGALDADTDNATAAIFVAATAARQRYMKIVITTDAAADAPVTAIAVLSRGAPVELPPTLTATAYA
jgi:hypothetical protein